MTIDPQTLPDQRKFNERLISVFERLNIPYGIGGSIASMAYAKTTRFTNDVDFMMNTDAELLELLVAEIEQWQVYIDPIETIFEFNLPAQLPINVY